MRQLEEAHNRHELLIELMRKEHEHNQRVRDAKERALGEQEAVIKIKERRQQSARVRRYYRDYQLQMRARMLKKRTREEKVSIYLHLEEIFLLLFFKNISFPFLAILCQSIYFEYFSPYFNNTLLLSCILKFVFKKCKNLSTFQKATAV